MIIIELTILAIVLPLTVCDISIGGGMNSNAVRGAKNVLSLGLSGAIIMLAVDKLRKKQEENEDEAGAYFIRCTAFENRLNSWSSMARRA